MGEREREEGGRKGEGRKREEGGRMGEREGHIVCIDRTHAT